MLYSLVDQKMQLLKSKRYFSMREVSKFCQETSSVLRYWEQEFPQLSPKKIQNQRRYQQKDIQTILTIQTLLRTEGLSIELAKKSLLNSNISSHNGQFPPQKIKTAQLIPSVENSSKKELLELREYLSNLLATLA